MSSPTAGDDAPDIKLVDLDGNGASLTHWRGTPFILTFLRHPG